MNKVLKKAPIVAENLKLLAHEGRLKILCFLCDGEKSVSKLEELTQLSQSQISQYLKKFEDKKIVKIRKDGKWSYYHICDQKIYSLIQSLHDIYCN